MKKAWRWPVGIAVVYGLFVLFLLVALLVFNMNNIELVQDDYYQDQVKYQEQIDRMSRAQALDTPVKIIHEETLQKVIFEFPALFSAANLEGQITFYRPSDQSMDFQVPLQLDEKHQQQLSIAHLAAGLWKIKLFWAADGQDYYQEMSIYK